MEENRPVLKPEEMKRFLRSGAKWVWDASSLLSAGFRQCALLYVDAIRMDPDSFLVPAYEAQGLEGTPVQVMLKKGLFRIVPDADDDARLFARLEQENVRIINLIVNDTERCRELQKAGQASALRIYFYRVNENGEIESLKYVLRAASSPRNGGNPREKTPQQRREERAHSSLQEQSAAGRKTIDTPPLRGYQIRTVPERIAIAPISVRRDLTAGDILQDETGTPCRLIKQVSTNNGAVTYSTDGHVWAKIYNRTALNTFTEAKVLRMLQTPLHHRGLCWPKSILRDADGQFRGYTMDRFNGIPLHLCVFKKSGIENNFPDWTKEDLCVLTETILDTVQFLHNKNVLFGCINPAAIRVVNTREVYFTDTDDFQIDGFPCLTHNLSFTAPELLDRKIYLAAKANENFAVAELVFMLMMPGKTPYAVGSDENPEDLIRRGNFPYTDERIKGRTSLPGMWRFMWSHLGSLKGSFCNVFRRGAKYNSPETRRDALYWKKAVGYYRNSLENPDDPESRKIYPRTFVREKGVEFYRCSFCGVEHPRYYFSDRYWEYRICNGCLGKRSDVSFTCRECGRTYYYNNETALFHKSMKKKDADWKDQKYCADCKKKTEPCVSCGRMVPYFQLHGGRCYNCSEELGKRVYRTVICKDCGRPFDITVKDHEYYVSKGFSEPVRCRDCRNARKNGGSSGQGGGRSSGESGGGAGKKGLFGWFH